MVTLVTSSSTLEVMESAKKVVLSLETAKKLVLNLETDKKLVLNLETTKEIFASFETVKKIVSRHGISHIRDLCRETVKKITKFSFVDKILLCESD